MLLRWERSAEPGRGRGVPCGGLSGESGMERGKGKEERGERGKKMKRRKGKKEGKRKK